MVHYLNNCQNYDHAKIYADTCPGAFYDLYTTGRDEKYIPRFQIGDECVVASKVGRRIAEQVIISRYVFEGSGKGKYGNVATFVLCGRLLRKESMTKEEAARNSEYSIFFNVLGHFKQASVLHGV